MPIRASKLTRKRMATAPLAPESPIAGPLPGVADRDVVNTVVRRLGFVALQVFNTIQGNLISHGRHQYAEALNDSLKPLVDLLVHFDLDDETTDGDTEVEHEIPSKD